MLWYIIYTLYIYISHSCEALLFQYLNHVGDCSVPSPSETRVFVLCALGTVGHRGRWWWVKGDGCEGDGAQLDPNKNHTDFSVSSISRWSGYARPYQYIPTLSAIFFNIHYSLFNILLLQYSTTYTEYFQRNCIKCNRQTPIYLQATHISRYFINSNYEQIKYR